jgi:hypothetical protein
MASYYGWRCGDGRLASLRRLLGAPHPIVRTAAAVYLSFDDGELALPVLRSMTTDHGFSGQWAAVALASRGESEFMGRALTVLAGTRTSTTRGVHRENLRARLVVLLSNSASASKVEPPPGWDVRNYYSPEGGVDTTPLYLEYVAWWGRVAGRIHLADPWLPKAFLQRVD